jgi:hypothetical protein
VRTGSRDAGGASGLVVLVEVQLDADADKPCILGDTFKQDCNDLRNIKVPDIHRELRPFEPAGQG